MGKREDERGAGLVRHYEGQEVLEPLLQLAGSALTVPQVKARFVAAQAQKDVAGQVIPTLFEQEPRFPSPEVALRLYSNLLGLWDRLAAGGPDEPVPASAAPARPKKEAAPRPAPPAPGPLPDPFVEAAWMYLDDLPGKERERLRHRYENSQPELPEFLRFEAGLSSDEAADTADTLLFELWAILDLARAEARLPVLTAKRLRQPPTGDIDPALARYVEDALNIAALDEQNPLPAGDAEKIRRLARTVVSALTAG